MNVSKSSLSSSRAFLAVATLLGVSVILAPPTASAAVVLAEWNFNSFSSSPLVIITTPIAPDVVGSNLSVGALSRGPGLSQFETNQGARPGEPATTVMRFAQNVGANTKQGSLDAGLFAEFSLDADTGYALNLTGFSIDARSPNTTQSRNFFVRYSTDNWSTFSEIIPPTLVAGPPGPVAPMTQVTTAFNAANLTEAVKFRIYGFNNETGSTNPTLALHYDNIVVTGSVAAVPGGPGGSVDVPVPASLALLATGLLGLGRLRRNRGRI